MLTQCPQCQTIYKISAAELGAARGYVECGECGTQFYALDRIADDPSFEAAASTTQTAAVEDALEVIETSDTPEQVPAESLPETNAQISLLPTSLEEDSPIDTDDPVEEVQDDVGIALQFAKSDEFDTTIELNPPDSAVSAAVNETSTLPAEEHAILFVEPELEERGPENSAEDDVEKIKTVSDPDDTNIDLDDVPPILHEEMMALSGAEKSRGGWAWGILALILLFGLATQAAWYFRAPLLAKYPALVEPATKICAELGCELQAVEPEQPIQLVSRDVRTHPRYENSLLVNASLINTGAETIEFPTVQLGLFDSTGTAMGIRQFAPNEYLDKSIDLVAGIPPGRSVHVVMELANTGDRATSFEFSFH
ncbi:MAG: DUF3426 domain-containing protein [Pseudomonadota bacterium]